MAWNWSADSQSAANDRIATAPLRYIYLELFNTFTIRAIFCVKMYWWYIPKHFQSFIEKSKIYSELASWSRVFYFSAKEAFFYNCLVLTIYPFQGGNLDPFCFFYWLDQFNFDVNEQCSQGFLIKRNFWPIKTPQNLHNEIVRNRINIDLMFQTPISYARIPKVASFSFKRVNLFYYLNIHVVKKPFYFSQLTSE